MIAHFHKVDLENVKELYEVRIFREDGDAEDCMELETKYQGVKLIRIDKDDKAWVSLANGLWGRAIFEQTTDFLRGKGVGPIEWSHRRKVHKLTSGEK